MEVGHQRVDGAFEGGLLLEEGREEGGVGGGVGRGRGRELEGEGGGQEEE